MIPNTQINPYWRCMSDGCSERAFWGEEWIPMFCDTHKHDEKLESLRPDRCLLCKRIFIVNKNKHCKPCSEVAAEKKELENSLEKPLGPPTHPNFTVSQYPVLRSTQSSPDVISRRSSPTLDPEQVTKALRRCSALSIMSDRSNVSAVSASSAGSAVTAKSKETVRTRGSVGSGLNLNLKMTKSQAQGELQLKVTSTKLKLKAAKATLAQFSPIEHSASKMAAIDAVALAEREVEDACKAWCMAARS